MASTDPRSGVSVQVGAGPLVLREKDGPGVRPTRASIDAADMASAGEVVTLRSQGIDCELRGLGEGSAELLSIGAELLSTHKSTSSSKLTSACSASPATRRAAGSHPYLLASALRTRSIGHALPSEATRLVVRLKWRSSSGAERPAARALAALAALKGFRHQPQ
jgi:hypothetical protein